MRPYRLALARLAVLGWGTLGARAAPALLLLLMMLLVMCAGRTRRAFAICGPAHVLKTVAGSVPDAS